MNRKSILKWLTTGMIFLGLILAFIPFGASLNPSAKSIANLPRTDISDLSNGQYKISTVSSLGGAGNGYSWGVLVYKNFAGEINVWDIPVKDKGVGLPDLKWWRPTLLCSEFGPTKVNGSVDESLPIKCHDDESELYWLRPHWKWTIEGKNIIGEFSDLLPATGVIEYGYFVHSKTS